jgi:hypothetical protein
MARTRWSLGRRFEEAHITLRVGGSRLDDLDVRESIEPSVLSEELNSAWERLDSNH